MRTALDLAEKCDYEQALVALPRLRKLDFRSQLTRAQLYTIEHVRVKSGWQATLFLAMGKQVTGGIRASAQSARHATLAESMHYLVETIHFLAREAARRAEADTGGTDRP